MYMLTVKCIAAVLLSILRFSPEKFPDTPLDSIENMSERADYYGIINYSNSILQNSSGVKDWPLMLYCYANAAQCYIKTDWPEKAKEYLDNAASLLDNIPPDLRNSKLYTEGFYVYSNALIMYHIYCDIDYNKAVEHVIAALDTARARGDLRQQVHFGLNYSILNTQIQEGFAYDGVEEIYDKAVELKDKKLIFSSAQFCAHRYVYLGDPATAKKYIEIAVKNLPEDYMNASDIYCDYAELLFTFGETDSARFYYDKALSMTDDRISSSALAVYLGYANFLSETGETEKAERLYQKGLALSDSAGTRWNRKSFYQHLYILYKEAGRYPEAIEYLEAYVAESDSVAASRQKKDLLEMRVRYETAVKEKIIAQQNERLSMILAIVSVLIVVSTALAILYFHKRSSYLTLFRLYSDILSEKEKTPVEDVTAASEDDIGNDRRSDDIFNEIEKKMREEHIYRQQGLTKEQSAAMIGTNRTYLTESIKKHTGLSFIYYVNSYRIREAIAILSDPSNDIPMKALIVDVGFKSSTTFYKLFSEATGKTPQTFRNEVLERG